jgi:hypothetical protein
MLLPLGQCLSPILELFEVRYRMPSCLLPNASHRAGIRGISPQFIMDVHSFQFMLLCRVAVIPQIMRLLLLAGSAKNFGKTVFSVPSHLSVTTSELHHIFYQDLNTETVLSSVVVSVVLAVFGGTVSG